MKIKSFAASFFKSLQFPKVVTYGRAFGRSPQRAKHFILLKAQEGRKTFQWNVFRREPSQGVP